MQFVKIRGATSDFSITPSGVPQEGHLSPLLFIIFINSINNYLSFCKVLLFADDIKIYSKITSISDCRQVQSDLDSFCLWTQRIGLTLNLNKCHSMTFHRKRMHIIFPYSLNGSPFERVSSVKDLGIYLTPSLSFEQHINITVGRA
uniref:RNA-directed DNA polymerase from mobile element jockey n=1 Tax=Schizaphis graminum TaxID=13262 RepID=A0A2S2PFU5_SCHGA